MSAPAKSPPPKSRRAKPPHNRHQGPSDAPTDNHSNIMNYQSDSGVPLPSGKEQSSHQNRRPKLSSTPRKKNARHPQSDRTETKDGSTYQPIDSTDGAGDLNSYFVPSSGQQTANYAAVNGNSPAPPKSAPQKSHPKSTPKTIASTPAKQAYAGPLFHASPAASSLPLPKQFSRSTSSVPQVGETPSRSSSKLENNTPPSSRGEPAVQQEDDHRDSPLDIFFNAHRAEREAENGDGESSLAKQRNASTGEIRKTPPPFDYGNHNRQSSHATRATFMSEVNGLSEFSDSDAPLSITPLKERLGELNGGQTSTNTRKLEEGRRVPSSDELKRALFGPPRDDSSPVIQAHAPSSSQKAPVENSMSYDEDYYGKAPRQSGANGPYSRPSLHAPNGVGWNRLQRDSRPSEESKWNNGQVQSDGHFHPHSDLATILQGRNFSLAGCDGPGESQQARGPDAQGAPSDSRQDQHGHGSQNGASNGLDIKSMEANLRNLLKLDSSDSNAR